MIVRALADIGLDALVGDRKAWVNVTRDFLLEVRPLPLPPGRTVIELVEDQAVDAQLLSVLGDLRDAGFRIALDDFRSTRAGRSWRVEPTPSSWTSAS